MARYVNKDAAGAIEVTLIEPQKQFTTCFFSNLHVGGFCNYESITHDYGKVAREGVRVVHEWASAIDRDKNVGSPAALRVPYDRLVVAPGIDIKFDSVPGYSEAAAEAMPHAWKAGRADPASGQAAQCAGGRRSHRHDRAAQPYRCPPGPYERISMFAHVLKKKGHKKSKIIVVDTKPPSPSRRCSWKAGRSTTPA